MSDAPIPFTNNQVEPDIRMMKVQQKIAGTFRSEDGAVNFYRVKGYISTVKKHGLSVLKYLVSESKGTQCIPFNAHRTP